MPLLCERIEHNPLTQISHNAKIQEYSLQKEVSQLSSQHEGCLQNSERALRGPLRALFIWALDAPKSAPGRVQSRELNPSDVHECPIWPSPPFCMAFYGFGLCPSRRFGSALLLIAALSRAAPVSTRLRGRRAGTSGLRRLRSAPSAPPLRPCAASAPSSSDLCPSIPRAKKSSAALQNAERATPNPTRAQQNGQRAEIPPSERGRAYTPQHFTRPSADFVATRGQVNLGPKLRGPALELFCSQPFDCSLLGPRDVGAIARM